MWRKLCNYLFICSHLAATANYLKTSNDEIYKSRKSFISHKDLEFLGDDKTLTKEVNHRISQTSPELAVIRACDIKNSSLPEEVLLDENDLINRSQRRSYDDVGHYSGDPKNYTLNTKILDMMRQAIYSTQFQLEKLDNIFDKYRGDARFRVGYMFNKLDEWLHDMKVIWSVVSKTRPEINDPRKRRFRTYKQLLYYATMLRRNIDITYLVEELIRIQNKMYETMNSHEKR